MDEKQRILKVLEKVETELKQSFGSAHEDAVKQARLSNPIYKNLAKFTNSKIGEKLSIKDLLR
jgi:hypothetical protein